MKTWMAAALVLATVASAHAAPLDQFDWRTQNGFEQAYREGVQYGFEHGSYFRTARWCSDENCLIVMDYDVADESYYFFTWLGSADDRGNEICAERPDHHLTCADDHGRVWTMRHVDGDWKTLRNWQFSWPVESSPVSKLIDAGFAAEVQTQRGFEQAYYEGVQYGFDHGSSFHVDPECNTEKCSVEMQYSVDGDQYSLLTRLGSADNRGNQICVQRGGDQSTCANNHGQVWTSRYVDGHWKEVRVWQDRRPAEPVEGSLLAKLKDIGLAALGFVFFAWLFSAMAYGYGVWVLVGCMWFAAAFATAALFAIRRLPGEWKDRLASVTPKLASMERWRKLTYAHVRAGVAAYVLAWRKRRAMKLLEQDFAAFTAQRDTHWMQQLSQGGRAIPPERLMALIVLAHPDKHNGSQLATETTQWLLSLRASRAT
jgi:hypothetical protein